LQAKGETMNQQLAIIIFFYAIMLFLLIPVYWLTRGRKEAQRAQKQFLRGILTILQSSHNIDDSASQIQILYRHLLQRYSSLDERYRSAAEMLEDLIVDIDSSKSKAFKEYMEIEPPVKERQRMLDVLACLKQMQPFSSLSNKQASLLSSMKQAIENHSDDLALNLLVQLGDEIETIENTARQQKSNNQTFGIVSIIGVVLTLFFGFVSLVQLLLQYAQPQLR
jgi:hypothetical protein